jgi:membrane fusion protein, multidrug efflux system
MSDAPRPDTAPAAKRNGSRRRRWLLVLLIGLPLLAYGAFWAYERITHVYTLDARVEAGMITLSSRVPGWVTRLDLIQGDLVRAGDVLVELDDREARIRLEALEARYAATEAEVGELGHRIELVRAQGKSRYQAAQARLAALEAAQAASESRLRQAAREHERIVPMARDGMVSAQALDQAAHVLEEAGEQQRRARAELRTAMAEVAEAEATLREPQLLEQQQRVLAARLRELDAERRGQRLEIDDRVIRSPIDAVIDRVFVEPGEYVGPGQNLVMLHQPGAVWVEARIKETQLAPVRIGQPVRLKVDAFPGQTYTGKVVRIASAATNQFALLPSPNPSGNFTKVTQRIPVRIAFDEPDDRLSPGMMVEVYIDIRRR